MKAEPLRRCRSPRYPTKLDALADPDLLESAVPSAWLRHGGLAGLAGALLAWNVTGCSDPSQEAAPNAKARTTATSGTAAAAPETSIPARVSPLFEYGEGRGATGCIVAAPPVFLSEDEALQIIREEFDYAGFALDATDVEVEGLSDASPRENSETVRGAPPPFRADAADSQRKVVVEFISNEEYFALDRYLDPELPRLYSTVQVYDTRDLARRLSKRAQDCIRSVYFGTFYDPLTRGHAEDYRDALKRNAEKVLDRGARDQLMQDVLERARARSGRLLRLQVKGFVDWLKGQGVV